MELYLGFTLVSVLLGLFVKKKHFNIYIISLALGLAFLAYHLYVLPGSDLVNHYNRMNLFRTNQISIIDMLNGLNPGTHLYFWFFSHLPNDAYLQAISVFISYVLMFRLAYNVCCDNDAPKPVYLLCTTVVMTSYNYYMMVNSIRMWLVFSVFFYLLYNEIVRNKNKIAIWIGYVILVLFHYGALLLIAGRMVALLGMSIKRMTFAKVAMLVLCGMVAIVFLNSSFFSSLVLSKVDDYSSYLTRGTWQTIIGFVRILVVCLLILHSFKKVNFRYKEYFLTVLSLCAIPLLMFTNYTLILRFGDAVIATASVAIVVSNKNNAYRGLRFNSLSLMNTVVLICSAICLISFSLFDYRYLLFSF